MSAGLSPSRRNAARSLDRHVSAYRSWPVLSVEKATVDASAALPERRQASGTPGRIGSTSPTSPTHVSSCQSTCPSASTRMPSPAIRSFALSVVLPTKGAPIMCSPHKPPPSAERSR
jgi:hypothetical protein